LSENTFECKKCGKRKSAKTAPECCGRKMVAVTLDACTIAFSAENSRSMENEEPCDDSRGG
jgi:hypothetical protein